MFLGLKHFLPSFFQYQTYLQSATLRLEEWRVKRTDAEEWMRHRQLPHELKDRVRRYHLHKWVTTRGVDEEAIVRGLPLDLRRDVKRHLCLGLVRRVSIVLLQHVQQLISSYYCCKTFCLLLHLAL